MPEKRFISLMKKGNNPMKEVRKDSSKARLKLLGAAPTATPPPSRAISSSNLDHSVGTPNFILSHALVYTFVLRPDTDHTQGSARQSEALAGEQPGKSEGRLKRRKSMEMLTKDLDIVQDDSCTGFSNPVVGHTAVGARVLFAGGVNKQVAQQEASLVVAGDAGPILGPRNLRWRDPTGHTFQDETLAFGDNDSLGFQRLCRPLSTIPHH
ncbi:hypothetical protein A6R68_12836 [Neotoma lepida]|uniref:Uncharacterized protein n=1 Tax=Neotoma lepida TaxID=56216 RepID=A0A1A6H1X5_NEOLE|nr:hypothetical protein A6R68_12836 [Neotoma lepida]